MTPTTAGVCRHCYLRLAQTYSVVQIEEATSQPSSTPTATPALIVVGDIDCDGNIDIDDIMVLLEVAVGLADPPQECSQPAAVTAQATAWGDLNCDGKIDGVDALMIVLQVAGFHRTPSATNCPEIGTPVG
jgi:hypothetical protein